MIRQDIQTEIIKKCILSSDEYKITNDLCEKYKSLVIEIFERTIPKDLIELFNEYPKALMTTKYMDIRGIFSIELLKNIEQLNSSYNDVYLPDYSGTIKLDHEIPEIKIEQFISDEDKSTIINHIVELNKAKGDLIKLVKEIKELVSKPYLYSEHIDRDIPEFKSIL